MTKQERDNSFTEFKSGKSRLLISSNITARGIDIQQVGTVVNLDISQDISTYLHRIGRSGRHGRKGVAINFVTRYDVELLKQIEKYYNISINEFKF
jgi:ATP-dependent RNA helicase